jgi:tripartite-type tricarboxylate transporter receptor subunit TctC
MFARAARIDLVHVPYRGTAPALQDLLAGQIASNSVGAHLPLFREGKLRILALPVTRDRRSCPTGRHSWRPGTMWVVFDWFGVVVPAATPASTVLRLNAAIRRANASQSMQDLMRCLGNTPGGEVPDAFTAMIRSDFFLAWGAIVKASGFAAQDQSRGEWRGLESKIAPRGQTKEMAGTSPATRTLDLDVVRQ